MPGAAPVTARSASGGVLRRSPGTPVPRPPSPWAREAHDPDRDADAARRDAETAASERLLRAAVRETGQRIERAGSLRVAGLDVVVTHASPAGHHRFDVGDRPHDAVVATLLSSLPGADPGGCRALADRVADSTRRTARYLLAARTAGAPEPHPEQAVLRGHPFHPTPKSAAGFTDADSDAYAPELGASFPLAVLELADDLRWGRRLDAGPPPPTLPVHPWQARHLSRDPRFTALLADGRVRWADDGPTVWPTSSVRTVTDGTTTWKLPLAVRLTHFVRHNPVDQCERALDAGGLLAGLDTHGVDVVPEHGYRGADPAVVGDLAPDLIVIDRGRVDPAAMVLAGLLEDGPRGEDPRLLRLVHAAGGDAAAWLRRYLAVGLVPMLQVFDETGIGFEAHVQNSLLVADGGLPRRMVLRDMEGTHVSRAGAAATRLHPASPLLYSPEEAWRRLRYHGVTNHLGHVVATLGLLHDEAALWSVVADVLRDAGTPSASALTTDRTLPAKANLLSAVAGRGEDPLYVDVPNPIRECAR